MLFMTCQTCRRTFDEADWRWDDASRTGRCPFCNTVGMLVSSVRGAPTRFREYRPLPPRAASRALWLQAFRWACLAFPCAVVIGSLVALLVSMAGTWEPPVFWLIVGGLLFGKTVFFYGFPLLWLILLASGFIMRLRVVEATVG